MRSLIPLSLILATLHSAYALKLPFQVRTGSHSTSTLERRANSTIAINNIGNAQYVANITLGGTQVRVLLDTGSSDLWVDFPSTAPSTTDLGKSLTLNYAIGATAGNIHTTTLQINDYTVDDQAFLLVADASTFSSDIHAQGYDGLMGLGPNGGSQVYDKVKAAGNSVLYNIFEQDTTNTTDNFISFLLDRKGDPTSDVTGQLTIGELVPGYEKITSMPQLDVETVRKLLSQEQHWQALTDKSNGIIGPDGSVIDTKSIVPKAPSKQLVAVFDSGFTFSQVPRDLSDRIYGRVQGAKYDATNEWWTLPCGQLLNLTINFGGNAYPVHPLDVVDDSFGITDSTGNRVCIGTFQPITSAFSLLGNYDMIMGMSFLRNTYTLMNFGKWVANAGSDDPYIQLLSVTDPSVARADFITKRLGGVDTTGDAKWALLSEDDMQHSPVSSEEKKKKYQEYILSRWPYIFAGCLVFVILVVGCCIWRCCCRRGRKGAKPKTKGFFGKKKEANTSYVPLQAGSQLSVVTPGGPRASQHGEYGAGGHGYSGNP